MALLRPARILLALVAILALLPAQTARGAPTGPTPGERAGPLARAFADAAAEFGVPVDLLLAIGYAESRWHQHPGEPARHGAWGVMGLVERAGPDAPLERAARLAGLEPAALRRDPAASVRAGAALLAALARDRDPRGALPTRLEGWFDAVAAYSQATDPLVADQYARQVFRFLAQGVTDTSPTTGETLAIAPQSVGPLPAEVGAQSGPDYPSAVWAPASPENYTVSSRPASYPIRYVVVHVTQGSYAGAISWFQNPAAQVSAHYVIRSSDGQVAQTVHEKDVAWHAGNWDYNTWSVGIEHEGWVNDCRWFTEAMYRSSAALVRYLTDKYGIPRDRQHIIGHNEVPGATHTDPGPCWNWDYYLSLIGPPPPTGSIAAAPATFVLGSGQTCSTTVQWSASGASTAEVWVSTDGGTETRLATGTSGTLAAPVRAPHTYQFRLYAGTSRSALLGSASVAAQSTSASPIFCDVPPSDWAYSPIQTLYQQGITSGCRFVASTGERWYCPDGSVTRAQMAIFLLKAKLGAGYSPPPASGTVFADVPAGYWAAAWIEELARQGITGGCSVSPPLYCPEASVTRAQMAVFLLKAKQGASYLPPAAGGIFADVPTSYWAASWIEELYRRGITGGCATSPLRYCPESANSRREMAVFLVRTFP